MSGYVYEVCPDCEQTIAEGYPGEMRTTNHVCATCPNYPELEPVADLRAENARLRDYLEQIIFERDMLQARVDKLTARQSLDHQSLD
jgi:hypothetical protein